MLKCQWNFQKYGIGQVQYDDHKRWVIQFHDELVKNPILTREKDWSSVKILESIQIELNYQVEAQDHIHSQVQSQERYNLPTCQCGSQEFDVGQLQMGVPKLNLGFQNNKSPGSNQ